ncbi:MAG TPA: winged helix-turn-helix domain-containing protein [Solirubrobacterales bacterium]|nr:winged helix-turn-helix domain-containing protein [Solirubrobacterales bacterium]
MISFEDRPEDVILRLLDRAESDLGSDDSRAPRRESPSRAAPGSVAPIQAYWIPVLQVLEESGGAAHSNDVIDALESRMVGVFTDRDYQPLRSGEVRWRNRVRFARLRMKEKGLISDSSRRGVWAITSRGRAYLRKAENEAG